MTAAEHLKAMRRHRGWTQSDLARAAGIPKSNVQRYEAGKAEPGFAKLQRMLAVGGYELVGVVAENPG